MTQDLKHLMVAILVEGFVELTELRTAGKLPMPRLRGRSRGSHKHWSRHQPQARRHSGGRR